MRELVDLTTGVVSRDIFVDDDIYQREQEQIFARAWLFVGHASQVPQAGDYVASYMGEEAVLLTRDAQQRLRIIPSAAACRQHGIVAASFAFDSQAAT